DSVPSLGAEPLPVAAAAASLRSEQRALTLAHRSVFAAPSLQVGVENGDPTQGGALPTIGLSLPLPLFNWNGGEVARATAARRSRPAPHRIGPAVTRALPPPLLAAATALLAACHGGRGAADEAQAPAGAQAVVGAGTAVATTQPFPQIVRAIGTVAPRPGRFA